MVRRDFVSSSDFFYTAISAFADRLVTGGPSASEFYQKILFTLMPTDALQTNKASLVFQRLAFFNSARSPNN